MSGTRLTAHDRELRSITEAAWQQQVVSIARVYGWRHYHPPRAGVRANGTWLDSLAAASVEVYVWRPGDLADVTAVLSRRAG